MDIEALINNEIYSAETYYELEYVQVSTGNTVLPTATIKLKKEDQVLEVAAVRPGMALLMPLLRPSIVSLVLTISG